MTDISNSPHTKGHNHAACEVIRGPIPVHYCCEFDLGEPTECGEPATHAHPFLDGAATWRCCCKHHDIVSPPQLAPTKPMRRFLCLRGGVHIVSTTALLPWHRIKTCGWCRDKKGANS